MKVDRSVNKIRIVMPSRNRRHDGDSHPRERKHVFERMAESGISRATNTKGRRSLMMTSAAP